MDLLERFADALDYPQSHPGSILDDCLRELPPGEAAARLRTFRDFAAGQTAAQMQERYTTTFDFNAACCLYAGHHLVGDDDRRAAFLVRLRQHYRRASFSEGHELPDHLSVMLRYAAANAADAEAQELVIECIVPALNAITGQLQKQSEPWADLTGAISLALEDLSVVAVANTSGREKKS